MNTLHLGDCLDVLRTYINRESIDLIYIDPPFNSKRNYNIFFDDKAIQTQQVAFEDTWSLINVQDSLIELQSLKTEKLYKLLMVYSEVAPFAFPYLVMMALRVTELHRVLKPTGSFYLHCDPTMSHYLKTVCDLIFGRDNFRNEIVWCYTAPTNIKNNFPRKHDIIIRYTVSGKWQFNFEDIAIPYSEETIARTHRGSGDQGLYGDKDPEKKHKNRLKPKGKIPEDWWHISRIQGNSRERLGYPTQKPKALMERIIKASSNEGDVVLDAFCGCGTTVDAAEGLNRQWIGIDISPVAISLIKRRLQNVYKADLSKYEIRGIPTDKESAIRLWQQNPFAFQDWWIMEFGAFSTTFGKKGADKGIDGIAKYRIDLKGNTLKAAFQVKGGKVQSKDMDALLGAMVKHDCEIGIFLTIKRPSPPMLETIALSGVVEVPGYKYPKLQKLTLSEFFSNKKIILPLENITFKTAKLKGKGHKQLQFL